MNPALKFSGLQVRTASLHKAKRAPCSLLTAPERNLGCLYIPRAALTIYSKCWLYCERDNQGHTRVWVGEGGQAEKRRYFSQGFYLSVPQKANDCSPRQISACYNFTIRLWMGRSTYGQSEERGLILKGWSRISGAQALAEIPYT